MSILEGRAIARRAVGCQQDNFPRFTQEQIFGGHYHLFPRLSGRGPCRSRQIPLDTPYRSAILKESNDLPSLRPTLAPADWFPLRTNANKIKDEGPDERNDPQTGAAAQPGRGGGTDPGAHRAGRPVLLPLRRCRRQGAQPGGAGDRGAGGDAHRTACRPQPRCLGRGGQHQHRNRCGRDPDPVRGRRPDRHLGDERAP